MPCAGRQLERVDRIPARGVYDLAKTVWSRPVAAGWLRVHKKSGPAPPPAQPTMPRFDRPRHPQLDRATGYCGVVLLSRRRAAPTRACCLPWLQPMRPWIAVVLAAIELPQLAAAASLEEGDAVAGSGAV